MAVQISTYMALQYGGAVMTTSAGDIYTVTTNYQSGNLEIYKSVNNGTNWTLADSIPTSESGFEFSYGLSADIDGNDIIHILQGSSTSGKNVNYNRFDTSTDTLVGAWETVTGQSAASRTAITIDSNNKPHILWAASSTVLKYSNKVSGSWLATPETISASGSYLTADLIAHENANDVQVIYMPENLFTPETAYYIHRSSGGWGSATPFTNPGNTAWRKSIVFDGTNYHYIYCNQNSSTDYLIVDDTQIATISTSSSGYLGGSYYNGYIYVPYMPVTGTTWKMSVYKVSTSQWLGPYDLSWPTGSSTRPKYAVYGYSHNHEHQSIGVNVIYTVGSSDTLYYDRIEDITSAESSTDVYLKGQSTASSSKQANVQSGTMVRGSQPAYMLSVGEDLIPDGDIANQTDWKNESGGTVLYSSLADSSDTTFVWKEPAVAGDYFEVSLSSLQDNPVTAGAHLIIWRSEQHYSTTMVVKVELRQGTTVIASDQQTLTGDIVEYKKQLTQGEVNSIGGDYSDLRLRLTVISVS